MINEVGDSKRRAEGDTSSEEDCRRNERKVSRKKDSAAKLDQVAVRAGLIAEVKLEQGGTDAGRENGNEDDAPVSFFSFNNLDNVDLPAYAREHNATLTFPEKLMLTLMHVDRSIANSGKKESEFPISWTKMGNSFVIRDKDALCSDWLPAFFQQTKFSSFTRKLYRWGFRQVSFTHKSKLSQPPGEMYFGNEYFHRDDKTLLTKMRSVTAVKRRREMNSRHGVGNGLPYMPASEIALAPFMQYPNNALLAQPMAPQLLPQAGLMSVQPNYAGFDFSNVMMQHAFGQPLSQFPGSSLHADPSVVPGSAQEALPNDASTQYLNQLMSFGNPTHQAMMQPNLSALLGQSQLASVQQLPHMAMQPQQGLMDAQQQEHLLRTLLQLINQQNSGENPVSSPQN